MNFIKLTGIDGSDIFMNMDNVTEIRATDRHNGNAASMIFMIDGNLTLTKERPDQILDAMRIKQTIIRS